jgi:hypothetical protein
MSKSKKAQQKNKPKSKAPAKKKTASKAASKPRTQMQPPVGSIYSTHLAHAFLATGGGSQFRAYCNTDDAYQGNWHNDAASADQDKAVHLAGHPDHDVTVMIKQITG